MLSKVSKVLKKDLIENQSTMKNMLKRSENKILWRQNQCKLS